MTVTADLTDRERLYLAMAALRRRGYWTPDPKNIAFFPSDALDQVPDGVPYVVWTMQTENAYGYLTCVTCKAFWIVDDLDDHGIFDELTFEEIKAAEAVLPMSPEQRDAAMQVHWLEAHGNLQSVFHLQWEGVAALICNVLRRYGLDAREPSSHKTCIAVLPADERLWPEWARGDGHEHCTDGGCDHGWKPRRAVRRQLQLIDDQDLAELFVEHDRRRHTDGELPLGWPDENRGWTW